MMKPNKKIKLLNNSAIYTRFLKHGKHESDFIVPNNVQIIEFSRICFG